MGDEVEPSEAARILDMGADGCFNKNYPPHLTAAIINFIVRSLTSQPSSDSVFRSDSLEVNFSTGRVKISGQDVKLSGNQRRLLFELTRNPGKVSSVEELSSVIWGIKSEKPRDLRVLTSRLRSRVERNPKDPQVIVTIPHKGYVSKVV